MKTLDSTCSRRGLSTRAAGIRVKAFGINYFGLPAGRRRPGLGRKGCVTIGRRASPAGLSSGARAGLEPMRRTGVQRAKITRTSADGRPEEISYERTFKRGETFEKDKIRLDQHMPSIEYSLVYNGGKVFGLLRGSTFTPKQQDVETMLSDRVHGLDALLRYKETGASVKFAGKDSQKGLDLWMLDLTDKDGNATRYYVSAKSWRVLWLEYEEKAAGEAKPVKFKRSFHDYRSVQGTLVPYRSVLYEGDKVVEESRVLTVTYGVKTEDAVFENSEAASS